MPDCHSHPVLTEPHRRSSYFAPGAHLDHPTGRRPVEPQRPLSVKVVVPLLRWLDPDHSASGSKRPCRPCRGRLSNVVSPLGVMDRSA
jgi:hypothetical protein